MKNIIYSSLSVVILSTNLLIVYPASAANSDNFTDSNLTIPQNNNQLDDFSIINRLVEKLKESINSFNDRLISVVKENKTESKVINSHNIRHNIKKLRAQLESLSQNPSKSNGNNEKTVKNIISLVDKIDQSIKPMEKGLTKDAILQVKKYLNVSHPNGNFGETTQLAIANFTSKKLQELDTQISQLQQVTNFQESIHPVAVPTNKFPSSSNLINPDSNVDIVDLKSNLDKLTMTCIIIGIILLIVISFCIYRITSLVDELRRIKQNNQNFVDIAHFKQAMNEVYQYSNNLDQKLKQIESSGQKSNLQNYANIPTPNSLTYIQPKEKLVTPQKSTTSYSSPSTNIPNPNPNINNNLVAAYNLNSRSLSSQATTVSEIEYTIEQRRLGHNIAPILEFDKKGNYWIINEGQYEYLVPKGGIKINEHNYYTISVFFECLEYGQGSNSNFTLVVPAKVSSIGEQWKLIEAGKLKF